MAGVIVNVAATPKLLDDLLVAAVTGPGLTVQGPGDPEADVTVTTADQAVTAESRVVIILPAQSSDPAEVVTDGRVSFIPAPQPEQLHDLVIDLVHALPPR